MNFTKLSALATGKQTIQEAAYTSLMENIAKALKEGDASGKLGMSKVPVVVLSPDKGFDIKDKVFGIRNDDPIVDFMLDAMGVPRDGMAIRIRSGFMQYDAPHKMLFISKYKNDLPLENQKAKADK
jgi:hypothetical protein